MRVLPERGDLLRPILSQVGLRDKPFPGAYHSEGESALASGGRKPPARQSSLARWPETA